MRNHQQSQEAICFNVQCVLLQLTAIFLILWHSEKDRRKRHSAALNRRHADFHPPSEHTLPEARWARTSLNCTSAPTQDQHSMKESWATVWMLKWTWTGFWSHDLHQGHLLWSAPPSATRRWCVIYHRYAAGERSLNSKLMNLLRWLCPDAVRSSQRPAGWKQQEEL